MGIAKKIRDRVQNTLLALFGPAFASPEGRGDAGFTSISNIIYLAVGGVVVVYVILALLPGLALQSFQAQNNTTLVATGFSGLVPLVLLAVIAGAILIVFRLFLSE